MTTYYATDITRVPYGVLFKTLWRNPVGLIVFLSRKALRFPFTPMYGAVRPSELNLLDWASLPDDVRREITPGAAEAAAAGMEQLFCAKGQYIGFRKSFAVMFLSSDGLFWGSAIRVWFREGALEKSLLSWSFHSILEDGRLLHTSPTKPSPLTDFLKRPEDVELLCHEDASVTELIHWHRERLTSADIKPVVFTRETLPTHVLEIGQKTVDWLISLGVYAPLSDKDVKRLSRQSV